jgi:hypothetical protein
MLRNLKMGRLLVIMALMIGVLVLPASAQDSPPGYTIVSTSSGIAIYQVNPDGTQTQIFYVSAAGSTIDSTAGQGGGDSMMTTADTMSMVSSDVISTGYLLVNTQALNVRSGPGAQYTILATVAGGDHLHVVGRSDDDVRENWWYVELANGQRGWVNNIHVFIRGSLSGTPVVEHHGVLIQPTLYIGYAGNPLFPSVPHQGVPVCYLPGNSEFVIVGRTAQSSFYEIEATCQDGSAMTGWIEAVQGIVRNPARIEFPITNK